MSAVAGRLVAGWTVPAAVPMMRTQQLRHQPGKYSHTHFHVGQIFLPQPLDIFNHISMTVHSQHYTALTFAFSDILQLRHQTQDHKEDIFI